jgi:hypothetical protein
MHASEPATTAEIATAPTGSWSRKDGHRRVGRVQPQPVAPGFDPLDRTAHRERGFGVGRPGGFEGVVGGPRDTDSRLHAIVKRNQFVVPDRPVDTESGLAASAPVAGMHPRIEPFEVHGGPADALETADAESGFAVGCIAHPVFTPERREKGIAAQLPVGLRSRNPLGIGSLADFEDHDLETCGRQLGRHHRSAGSRAHDAGIDWRQCLQAAFPGRHCVYSGYPRCCGCR